MNNKKSILYILLAALGLILLYNYMIAPILMQNSQRMGMGMHWRMYHNTDYLVDFRFIFLIAILIAGILLFEMLKPQARVYRCSKCGNRIQSEHWSICPFCGTPVNSRRG